MRCVAPCRLVNDLCHLPTNHKPVLRVETYCCPSNLEHRTASTSVPEKTTIGWPPKAKASQPVGGPIQCRSARERGISWTTDRTVAEGFALGKRYTNKIADVSPLSGYDFRKGRRLEGVDGPNDRHRLGQG
jgi:hypothetical protein